MASEQVAKKSDSPVSQSRPARTSVVPAVHIQVAPLHGLAPSRGKTTDVRVVSTAMYLLPVVARMPLKFGSETMTRTECVRVRITVCDSQGGTADGWGETPLSVQWAWPSTIDYQRRLESMIRFCGRLTHAWPKCEAAGHPMEVGHDFLRDVLPVLRGEHNVQADDGEQLPYLASLIAASAFDIAMHDAYGNLHGVDIYDTYNTNFMNRDLSAFLEPTVLDPGARGSGANGNSVSEVDFSGQYPEDFFVDRLSQRLAAWHLVGGLDPLEASELHGEEPRDGVPVLLRDWISTDSLKCLKIKLRGNDSTWDYDRLLQVGTIAVETGVESLSADFNCCVRDPAYVNDVLDRLCASQPTIYQKLIYVEQPFAYDLERDRLDVRSVSERKPLFLDESAHDWQHVRLGRELGWTGVALKTCKTQTGALLSLCWAKAHGMPLMVQDLTNPMLAQIPHVRLAAHAGTICGVETNAMQFYPAASAPEAAVHPGLYRRRDGEVDLSTLSGSGFGYRLEEIARTLPEPMVVAEAFDAPLSSTKLPVRSSKLELP